MGEGYKNGRHHRGVKHQGDLNLDCLAGLCAKPRIPVGVNIAASPETAIVRAGGGEVDFLELPVCRSPDLVRKVRISVAFASTQPRNVALILILSF